MLLGALVGHNGLDLFDENSFHKLGPVIVVGLGWLGFFFGTNLELRTMRKFPKKLYFASFFQAVITFVIVLTSFYFYLRNWDMAGTDRWLVIAIMAATAAGTAPASLFMLGSERRLQGHTYETLRFLATVDDIPGLVALGVMFSFAPNLHHAKITNPLFWFCLQIVLGFVFAYLLRTLKLQELDEAAGDLVVFGVIGLSSGLCLYLHLSPLFVSAITGMVAVNISDHSEGIYERVSRREHAFYVLFLLLSGCLWDWSGSALVGILLLYIGSRVVGKLVGTYSASRLLPREHGLPAYSGMGLISQGGLAVAMVVSYRWAFETYLVDWAVSVVLVAVVINELLAPWAELSFLDKGEGL